MLKSCLVLLACILFAGCREKAPDVHAKLVEAALFAQAGGPGGCRELLIVDTVAESFFPVVNFFRGECVLEHGAVFSSLAGLDDEGVIYMLNSPSGFRFLIRRHPPVGIDSTTLVSYARLGLVFSGVLQPSAALVWDPATVPDSVLIGARLTRSEVTPSGVQAFGHGADIVWVTTLERGTIQTHGAWVNRESGEVVLIRGDAGGA